jgi:hypothetical protein
MADNDYYKLTYEKYTDDTETSIISKMFPKNTILYTYLNIDFNQFGWATTDELKRKVVMQYLFRNAFNITYNHETNSWKICISDFANSYKYYYTAPMSSFGVNPHGKTFNICMPCVLAKDMKFAYLKSCVPDNFNDKSLIDEKTFHRLQNVFEKRREISKNTHKSEYVYKGYKNVARLTKCYDKKLFDKNFGCRRPNEYDVCLTNDFKRTYNLDGTIALAGLDSLGIYKNDELKFTGMFHAHRLILQQIDNHLKSGDSNLINKATSAKKIYTQSFTTLEADKRHEKGRGVDLLLGYPEMAHSEFGHYHLQIIDDLLKQFEQVPDKDKQFKFSIANNTPGSRTMEIIVSDEYLIEFIQNYIINLIPIVPLSIISSNNIVNLVNQTYNTAVKITKQNFKLNAIDISHNLLTWQNTYPIYYNFISNLQYINTQVVRDINYNVNMTLFDENKTINHIPFDYSSIKLNDIENGKLEHFYLLQKIFNMFSMTNNLHLITDNKNLQINDYFFFEIDRQIIAQSPYYQPYSKLFNKKRVLQNINTYLSLLQKLFNKLELNNDSKTEFYNKLFLINSNIQSSLENIKIIGKLNKPDETTQIGGRNTYILKQLTPKISYTNPKNKLISRQASRQTSMRTSRQASMRTSRQASMRTSRQASMRTSRQASMRTSRQASMRTSRRTSGQNLIKLNKIEKPSSNNKHENKTIMQNNTIIQNKTKNRNNNFNITKMHNTVDKEFFIDIKQINKSEQEIINEVSETLNSVYRSIYSSMNLI